MVTNLNDSIIKKDEVEVALLWHPDKGTTFSKFKNMVTNYVQIYIEINNAKRIPLKTIPSRS